eukprot:13328149-Alexandrium_andersonii.AAC.1
MCIRDRSIPCAVKRLNAPEPDAAGGRPPRSAAGQLQSDQGLDPNEQIALPSFQRGPLQPDVP